MVCSIQSQRPLVSVIIPFRNGAPWLEACCASVRSQTLHNWEALLIDDDSSDSSMEIAQAQARCDHRFVVLNSVRASQQAPGPWMARNLGLDRASGWWIAFLDVDDLWHPHKLAQQIEQLEQQQANFCVTAYYRFDHSSGRIQACRIPPLTLKAEDLQAVNPLPMSSVVVQSSLVSALRFRALCHEDHEYWQRLFSQRSVKYLRLRQPLMAYRLHEENLTRGLRKKIVMKIQNIQATKKPILWSLLQVLLRQVCYALDSLHWQCSRQKIGDAGFATMLTTQCFPYDG